MVASIDRDLTNVGAHPVPQGFVGADESGDQLQSAMTSSGL
jgi:bifunctional ADP-heptose synthase (sugar kinase/adenylyltransferase)